MSTKSQPATLGRPLRIGFFTDDYLPYVHGVTTSIDSFRRELEARGHQVTVVAPKKPGYKDENPNVVRITSVNSMVFDKRYTSVLYPGIARKFDKYEFDVVHSHTQFYMGGLAQMIAKRQNIPHISTMHTLFPELIDDYPLAVISGVLALSLAFPIAFKQKPVVPERKAFLNPKYWKRSHTKNNMKEQGWKLCSMYLNQVSAFIAPSQHLYDQLRAHGATGAGYVLPNGVNRADYLLKSDEAPLFQKSSNEQWIVATGRLSGEKRQIVLVEAMRTLQRSHPHVKLYLIGDGPEKNNIEKYVAEHKLRNVILCGQQPREVVAGMLRQADISCLASYHFDNQPMVVLEALIFGVPYIYCDERLTEGLKTSNSLLTDSPDAEGFTKAFRVLLDDKERLHKMSHAAKRLSAEFDISRLADRLMTIYNEQITSHSLLHED